MVTLAGGSGGLDRGRSGCSVIPLGSYRAIINEMRRARWRYLILSSIAPNIDGSDCLSILPATADLSIRSLIATLGRANTSIIHFRRYSLRNETIATTPICFFGAAASA